MVRRIFLSFRYEDRAQAHGFRLLRFNDNVDTTFFDQSLISPVDSQNEEYIKRCIRERMDGTSVTAVLIGDTTHESDMVNYEIEQTLKNGKGLLGIYLKGHEGAPVPPALAESGAEVIEWDPDRFNDAIERAAGGPKYVGSPASAPGGGAQVVCAR